MKCKCEQCGVEFTTARANNGKSGRCAHCGEKTRIFESGTSPPPEPQHRVAEIPADSVDQVAELAGHMKKATKQLQGIGCMLLVITTCTVIGFAAWVLSAFVP